MPTLPAILMGAGAGMILVLGLAHLLFTFRGPAFMPRDRALRARMEEAAPVISRETTMWKAWVGFNASHSFGAILFGAVYGYLALLHEAFLFGSRFLLVLGLLLLCGYAVLAQRYWFSTPFRGILLALGLYVAALLPVWG
ncbi:LIC_13387 family protein [Massilia niabensis]|uniref:Transmembrane protein n=1 Tax=Massilia niabensis TaxID=544910 RepID=A0ABW0L9M2_9BURK